jgi:oligopeptide transport system substrate-binding protein
MVRSLMSRWALRGLTIAAMAVTLPLTAGGNLNYNLAMEPKTLDPHKASGVKENHVILNILEGLCRTDAQSQPIPALAERWEMTSDALKFTFHLRTDAKWNIGAPVTAEDFVFAWRRIVNPKTAATYAEQLFFVENAEALATGKLTDLTQLGVRAVTSHTLEVRLRDPAPFFPAVTAHYTYLPLPEAYVTANPGWAAKPETYLSNGPFLLDTWRSNDRIILKKNPAYYDAAKVKLDTITMPMIVNESTALLQFESGKLDLHEKAPLPDQKRLLDAGKLKIEPYLGTYFVSFNCTAKPFDDARVRKAFSLAINRDQITKAVVRGGSRPARGLVPTGVLLDGKDVRQTGGDLVTDNAEEARKLLAEAGYPGGKGFPRVKYLTNDLELHRTVSQALQSMWKQVLGVQVDLQFKEWKVYLDDKERGNYQMARYGWIADYADPITFLGLAGSTNPNNHMRFKNEAMDGLLSTLRATVNPADRLAAAVAAEKHLMAEAPVAPIYFYANDVLEAPRVKGTVRNALGFLYFKEATVD